MSRRSAVVDVPSVVKDRPSLGGIADRGGASPPPATPIYDSDTDEDLDMFEAHEDDEGVEERLIQAARRGAGATSTRSESSSSPSTAKDDTHQPVDFQDGVCHFKIPIGPARPLSAKVFPSLAAQPTAHARLGKPPPVPKSWKTKRVRQEWTTEEDELFLKGLKLHGTKWGEIDKMIQTRSRTQIRTHYRYYTRTLEKNTISDLYGIGKKVKLRQRGRPRLQLRRRDEEVEKLMPELVQEILKTVRNLHEKELKETVKTASPRTAPMKRARPHDNLCSKFVLGDDQLIPVKDLPSAPRPVYARADHVPSLVVPGRAFLPKIQTVDSSLSVKTNMFGGLRLSRQGDSSSADSHDAPLSTEESDTSAESEYMAEASKEKAVDAGASARSSSNSQKENSRREEALQSESHEEEEEEEDQELQVAE